QAAQNLTLYRREIEKAVQDQQFDFAQPGNGWFRLVVLTGWFLRVVLTPQHLQGAQLVGVFVRQPMAIQRRRVTVVNQGHFAIEIELRSGTLDFGLCTLDFGLWIFEFGLWTLDFGFWNFESGIWNSGLGILTLDLCFSEPFFHCLSEFRGRLPGTLELAD